MRSILTILQDARSHMIAGEHLELVACLVELQGHADFERFKDAAVGRSYSHPSTLVVQNLLRYDLRGRFFRDGIYDLASFADQNEWREP